MPTRQNIKSHLQKYRLLLAKRKEAEDRRQHDPYSHHGGGSGRGRPSGMASNYGALSGGSNSRGRFAGHGNVAVGGTGFQGVLSGGLAHGSSAASLRGGLRVAVPGQLILAHHEEGCHALVALSLQGPCHRWHTVRLVTVAVRHGGFQILCHRHWQCWTILQLG